MIRLVILLVAWMALSALVAYVADYAGRRLGKRRLSVFNLRPRHTAILITTSTGAIIAMLTFGLLLFVSSDIREALTQWDTIVARNHQLAKESSELWTSVTSADASLAQAEKKADEARAATTRALAQRDDVEKKLAEAQAQNKILDQSIAKNARLLAVQEQDLKSKTQELEQSQKRLGIVNVTLKKNEATLAQQQRYLTNASRVLLQLRQEADQAYALANRRVYGDLIVATGDELARTVVPSHVTRAQASRIVLNLLNSGRTLVAERNKDRGGKWPTGQPFVILRSSKAARLTPEQCQNLIVDNLIANDPRNPGGVVLLLVARSNAIAGETVIVDIELFSNRLVFEKGNPNAPDPQDRNEIIRTVIDGSQPKDTIVQSLYSLLKDKLRPTALNRGLMPATDGSIGSMPPEQIQDVINAIRAKNRPVTVAIYAQEDTWTAGPLKLRFSVDPDA